MASAAAQRPASGSGSHQHDDRRTGQGCADPGAWFDIRPDRDSNARPMSSSATSPSRTPPTASRPGSRPTARPATGTRLRRHLGAQRDARLDRPQHVPRPTTRMSGCRLLRPPVPGARRPRRRHQRIRLRDGVLEPLPDHDKVMLIGSSDSAGRPQAARDPAPQLLRGRRTTGAAGAVRPGARLQQLLQDPAPADLWLHLGRRRESQIYAENNFFVTDKSVARRTSSSG